MPAVACTSWKRQRCIERNGCKAEALQGRQLRQRLLVPCRPPGTLSGELKQGVGLAGSHRSQQRARSHSVESLPEGAQAWLGRRNALTAVLLYTYEGLGNRKAKTGAWPQGSFAQWPLRRPLWGNMTGSPTQRNAASGPSEPDGVAMRAGLRPALFHHPADSDPRVPPLRGFALSPVSADMCWRGNVMSSRQRDRVHRHSGASTDQAPLSMLGDHHGHRRPIIRSPTSCKMAMNRAQNERIPASFV